MKQQSGVILIQVILFISLLSILLLSQLQGFWLQNKMQNLQTIRRDVFWEMENELWHLMQNKTIQCDMSCLIKKQKRSYRVTKTDLGIFPCLMIEEKGQIFASHHWQISIESKSDKTRGLSVRYAEKTQLTPCLSDFQREILSGVQSWHLISSY